jgi:hypothetical protein
MEGSIPLGAFASGVGDGQGVKAIAIRTSTREMQKVDKQCRGTGRLDGWVYI